MEDQINNTNQVADDEIDQVAPHYPLFPQGAYTQEYTKQTFKHYKSLRTGLGW